MSWIGRIALVLMPLALWACGGGDGGSSAAPEGPVMKQLQGEVFYRERILLPPGAELEVQLQDISRADAPAQVIASVTMPLEKSPPYAFSLQYDAASIDSRMRYGISARIEVDGIQGSPRALVDGKTFRIAKVVVARPNVWNVIGP